jgi:hypothetical protein
MRALLLELPVDGTRSVGTGRTTAALSSSPDRATLLAGAAAVLHRYTNSEAFALGSVEAGRLTLLHVDATPELRFSALREQLADELARRRPAEESRLTLILTGADGRLPDGCAADLVLRVADGRLALDYDGARLGDGGAARLLGHLDTLLAAAAADPGCALGALPLLGD